MLKFNLPPCYCFTAKWFFFLTEQVEAEVGANVQPAPLLLFHSEVLGVWFFSTEQVEAEVRKFNLPPCNCFTAKWWVFSN